MLKNNKLPDNQITVYQTPDGKINIEVLYANENIWLSQKRIAEIFDIDRSVVTKHLKNIFSENELQEDSVCASYAHTAEDGKEYEIFKKIHDKNYISDFDKEIKHITGKKDDDE
jgi:hypothetical protein